jgi:hypothetical protein
MNSDIYVYKLVVDNGGAPCVWRGLLSLAICKPKIRKAAKKDSLIFGFGGKNLYGEQLTGERLIYVAKVTAKLECDEYYQKPKYAKRPDCIYEVVSNKPKLRQDARYHSQSDELKKDVGENFENAYVLLSDDFRYFGKKGTDDYKQDFLAVKKLVEGLKRGHRVNHSVELRNQLISLAEQLWHKHSRKVLGSPSDSDHSRVCNQESPGCTVK